MFKQKNFIGLKTEGYDYSNKNAYVVGQGNRWSLYISLNPIYFKLSLPVSINVFNVLGQGGCNPMVAVSANQSGANNIKQLNNCAAKKLGRNAGVKKPKNFVNQNKTNKRKYTCKK